MTTKIELFQQAVELLKSFHYGAELYENYSGRAMFGETCPGIVTDAPAVLIGYVFGKLNAEPDEIPKRIDNLGISTIYY